jgi:hypothetical protein
MMKPLRLPRAAAGGKVIDAPLYTKDPLRTRLAGETSPLAGVVVRIQPRADEELKWPVWKTALFILIFCGLFWSGVIWLGLRLFG